MFNFKMMSSRTISWLFIFFFSSACQFLLTLADHNRCAAYTCEMAKMHNHRLKRSDSENSVGACQMKCCGNYLCNAFEWVENSKSCYFSITLLEEIHLDYSKDVLSCVLRSYKGTRSFPADYGPGFTFNCRAYSCRPHMKQVQGNYFAVINATYQEGCAKNCCDNHQCKSFYWVEKSRNCFLSQLRLVDTTLISHSDTDSCELSADMEFGEPPHSSPPPYAMPIIGIIAFIIIVCGIGFFCRYRQKRAHRNTISSHNLAMPVPDERNTIETGNVPQGIGIVRRMSETDTNNHQNSKPQFVRSVSVEARTMNPGDFDSAPMISGTPVYPVQQPVELPPPQGIINYTGYTRRVSPPPSYAFAMREGASGYHAS